MANLVAPTVTVPIANASSAVELKLVEVESLVDLAKLAVLAVVQSAIAPIANAISAVE